MSTSTSTSIHGVYRVYACVFRAARLCFERLAPVVVDVSGITASRLLRCITVILHVGLQKMGENSEKMCLPAGEITFRNLCKSTQGRGNLPPCFGGISTLLAQ